MWLERHEIMAWGPMEALARMGRTFSHVAAVGDTRRPAVAADTSLVAHHLGESIEHSV